MKEEEYDLIVIGATPGGIACAVRAAREGMRVLLTNYHDHIGGILSSGLSTLDTQFTGRRCNILSEFCEGVLDHYRTKYGEVSDEYRSCLTRAPSQSWIDQEATAVPEEDRPVEDTASGYYGRLHYEPHVGEAVISRIVKAENNVTVERGCYPLSVIRCGRTIDAVIFRYFDGRPDVNVSGALFVDATYEGDVAAAAGVRYRVGRESRSEFGEIHAGKIFTDLQFVRIGKGGFPREAVEGKLNPVPYDGCTGEVFAGSTGEGDCKVQAYNLRMCLCSAPDNRVFPAKPDEYDREVFLKMRSRWGLGTRLANRKMKWNAANLPGGADDYPNADWETRKAILKRHRDHALGFLYFLQHDKAVPEALREEARRWGLAKDEFADNGNIPYELYVREARRMVGRYIFTEHDATLAPGMKRTPVHHDSIAIAEHPMDSHSVSFEARPGSRRDGKILLSELTRPSQIPFRTLLPKEVDNLIVTGCLSSSHVGWGTLRVEPVMMHVGEFAGFAAALATKSGCMAPAIDLDRLQRQLVENGLMISFFNDFDMATDEPWVPAVQYFGTKSFFGDYDARPEEPLTENLARHWAKVVCIPESGRMSTDRQICRDSFNASNHSREITFGQFIDLVRRQYTRKGITPPDLDAALHGYGWESQTVCSRGEACRLLYVALSCS